MGRAPVGTGPRTPTGPRVATSPITGSLPAAAATAAAAVAAATTGLRATTGSKAMALRVRPPPSPIRCSLVSDGRAVRPRRVQEGRRAGH